MAADLVLFAKPPHNIPTKELCRLKNGIIRGNLLCGLLSGGTGQLTAGRDFVNCVVSVKSSRSSLFFRVLIT